MLLTLNIFIRFYLWFCSARELLTGIGSAIYKSNYDFNNYFFEHVKSEMLRKRRGG
jgi:hypothetical protein